jgi:hypothetical protein
VTTDALGNLSSQLLPVGPTSADFVQNQTAADQAGGFRLTGSGALGGNLGIGTSSPGSRLSISPGTTEAKLTLYEGGPAAHYGLGVSSGQLNYHVLTAGDRHVFYAGGRNGDGTELLRIQGNGNVGIGTTPASGAPTARLDVNGSTRLRGLTTAGVVTTDASGNLGSTAATALGGSFILNGSSPQAGADFNISGNGVIGGSAGIGTATPTARQEVVGDLRVTYVGGGAGQIQNAGEGFTFNNTLANLGQSFTLNAATTITSITLRSATTYNTTLTIRNGAGSAAPALTTALPISFTAFSPATVTLPTPLSVGPGVYTLVLASGAATFIGNAYAGGTTYFGPDPDATFDLEFTVGFSSGPGTTLYASGGNVGIGTSAPVARLHVSGGVSATPGGAKTFFSAVTAYFTGGQVFVNDVIVAGALNVTSDRRIKRVIGLSDRAADLALLNQVRITDYTYIDQHANTDQVVKKVIAQEVKELLPAAVSQSRQAIPNVYERAASVSFAGGFITLRTTKPHELPATGGTLRLYTPQNQELTVAATVLDAHTVRFASADSHADGLFVYGKYVDDFLSVDYDALTTLNVSATQELARRVEALEARNTALEARAARVDADHADLQTLKEQLARLLGEAPAGVQARR